MHFGGMYSGIPALRRALSRRSRWSGSLYLKVLILLISSNENPDSILNISAV